MNNNNVCINIPLLIEVLIQFNLYHTLIVVFITIIVFIFVKVYLNNKLFIIILIRFVLSIIILLNRGNSFILLLFGWDLLGLTRLILVLYYNSIHVNRRAFNIIIINSISDTLFLIIIIVYSLSNVKQNYSSIIIIATIVGISKSAI